MYGEHKKHGLIVDYIGVSKKLGEALAAYRSEDVQSALKDLDALHDALRVTHKELMALVAGVPVHPDPKRDWLALLDHIATEDAWYVFRGSLDAFIKAYAALSPDPRVLPFQFDLKRLAVTIRPGRLRFEQVEETDWKKYSEKLRAMLDEQLEVTGLSTVCKLRSLSDPAFWDDFDEAPDLKTAAVRKLTELKMETSARSAKNAARYGKFSDRIKALIKQFSSGLLDAAAVLDAARTLAEALRTEDAAHLKSGLNERAYGIAAILESFKLPDNAVAEPDAPVFGGGTARSPLYQAASEIDTLYTSETSAPPYWQDKTELKKMLRGQVRRMLQHLRLDGWQKQIPLEVESYALQHYSRP